MAKATDEGYYEIMVSVGFMKNKGLLAAEKVHDLYERIRLQLDCEKAAWRPELLRVRDRMHSDMKPGAVVRHAY